MTLPPGASEVRPVGGGDINEAFHVVLADGREAFVKTRPDAAPGEYAAEAAGLRWLAEPGALRTPRVLDVDERYLELEWIPPGRLEQAGAEELGRGLATTHAAGAPGFGDPAGGAGSGSSGFGSLRLPNEPAADWPTFYAERRLRPLAAIARERRALSDAGIRAVERVCERLPELVGPAEPPARLHGDLWSGNVMADAEGRPWLIDPSAYGGHREVDLAMLRLFGAPSARLFAAYEEAAPLAGGWQERVELHQLLPLLVHALLFGGSYVAAAERVAVRYV
ncbi:MAG TPA: fructosamine kinase family protein [Solirubrobacteraceae bacterium]|nr:fructosamine kinase family protein [Solirubrobacteraceae bacterium]